MKKVTPFFSILLFFFLSFPQAQAQVILNQGPNDWTLVLKGERIKLSAFESYPLPAIVDSIDLYALEMADETIYAHGFCRLIPDEQGYYFLQNLEPIPIFLLNKQKKEILVESHRTAFILRPGERREIKDAHTSYDGAIELKVTILEEDGDVSPISSWYELSFDGGQGVAVIKE
jgi:hypothetical protein